MNRGTKTYGDKAGRQEAHPHHEITRALDVLDHHSLEGTVQDRPQLCVHTTVLWIVLVRQNALGDCQIVYDPVVPTALDCLNRLRIICGQETHLLLRDNMHHVKDTWSIDPWFAVANFFDQQIQQKFNALSFLDCLSLSYIHSMVQKPVTRQRGNENGDTSKG